MDHLGAVSVRLLDEPSEGVLGLDLVLGVGGPALRQKRIGGDLAGMTLLISGFQAASITANSTSAG